MFLSGNTEKRSVLVLAYTLSHTCGLSPCFRNVHWVLGSVFMSHLASTLPQCLLVSCTAISSAEIRSQLLGDIFLVHSSELGMLIWFYDLFPSTRWIKLGPSLHMWKRTKNSRPVSQLSSCPMERNFCKGHYLEKQAQLFKVGTAQHFTC